MQASASAKPAAMSAIKSALPEFFALSLENAYAGAYIKGAALETFAARLAACAIEAAHSGNTNGLQFLRATVDNLTMAKKHARASTLREVLHYIEGIKPASVKSPDVEVYRAFGEDAQIAIFSILCPVTASDKPKAPPVNWKAECLTARAERDALAAELAAAKKAVETLKAKLSHATAMRQIKETQPA